MAPPNAVHTINDSRAARSHDLKRGKRERERVSEMNEYSNVCQCKVNTYSAIKEKRFIS